MYAESRVYVYVCAFEVEMPWDKLQSIVWKYYFHNESIKEV